MENEPFQPLGKVLFFRQEAGEVTVHCTHGVAKISHLSGVGLRAALGRDGDPPVHPLPPFFAGKPRGPVLRVETGGIALGGDGGPAVRLATDPLGLDLVREDGSRLGAVLEPGLTGGRPAIRQELAPGLHIYGLGEKTGWLDKRGRRYLMRNTDVWLENPAGMGIATDPLYASLPVFLVHGPDGTYGLFLDNPEFSEFDFSAEGCFRCAAPARTLNLYLFPGPTPAEVVRQYTALTGRTPQPALWTLGYHQSRWGYASADEIRGIAQALRRRRIPADGIWLDIDYMDGFRVFTWNRRTFPAPATLFETLQKEGFQAVTVIDPGVKADPEFGLYAEGKARGLFLRHPDGREYHGRVWPGRCAFPDFHLPETRLWWAQRVRRWLQETGVAGIWNDMNEPSATDLSGSLHRVRHAGGRLSHAEARNTYAMEMNRATWEAFRAERPQSRPFILTRAAFSGVQALAAMWGGDNSSYWEHLAASLPLLMNLGLSGVPFVGVDIGGFGGNADGELLARWTQAGALYPFCRNHAAEGTRPQEPWRFGPEVEGICRRYIGLRYRLLPLLYNLFHEAGQTGAPVMRPLLWHYPRDPRTFNLNDQFLLGKDLLAAPVLWPGRAARAVYLPEGVWYRWGEDPAVPREGPGDILAAAPLAELPLFVRGGAVIPTWPEAPHTGAIDMDRMILHIWPGEGGIDLYEDDYRTPVVGPADSAVTPFRLTDPGDGLALAWDAPRGGYVSGRSRWELVFHERDLDAAWLDGKRIRGVRAPEGFRLEIPDDRQPHTLFVRRGDNPPVKEKTSKKEGLTR